MARTCNDIRSEFIRFFERRGHRFVPSSSLLPAEDPTLLFANAGMNQFKPIFLGQEKRDYNRAVNSQKCIRAGGKHNDLEDVGHDCYHHTFFEMLGNWSFGDYFKKEAIAWAWELLTKVWGLPKERLHATVFAGDPAENLAPDAEAAELWRSVTDIDPSHIHQGGKKDNFWEMGETGPCGPCSEIHMDLTPDKSGAKLVNAGDARVIEIWNLVFIQFNRGADGKLAPLPARHVDTGMGFERVSAVLAGKKSNYATDLFVPIIKQIETMTAHRYGSSSGLADRFDVTSQDDIADVACRVIADHARTLVFAIADGVIPSNEGRGYVLRRILRRAARYGRQYLKIEGPFLVKLVPAIVEMMGGVFGELPRRQKAVTETIAEEEESFGKTLDNGIRTWWSFALYGLNQAFYRDWPLEEHDLYFNIMPTGSGSDFFREQKLLPAFPYTLVEISKGIGGPVRDKFVLGDLTPEKVKSLYRTTPKITGVGAFMLYATFGFPLDLTQLMAEERGLEVDVEGFEREMDKHREVSGGGEKFKAAVIANLPATDDSPKYGRHPIEAKVLGWVVNGQFVAAGALEAGSEATVVLDRTNFYAEQGGQVGDTGLLIWDGGEFVVEDTKVVGSCILHQGVVKQGRLTIGQTVCCEVDSSRMDTMRNHTATHLLNWALRNVLGEHVNQAGSVVASDRLRFDFSHNKALSDEELAEVERLVNQRVLTDEKVTTLSVPLAEAMRIPGVRAVFGEKYPDPVRVVAVGTDDLLAGADAACAIEFCGGTHLERTGQVGLFKILSEESVAKGVRRITALTGWAAVEHVQQVDGVLRRLSQFLRAGPAELADRVEALHSEIKQLRKRPAATADGGGELVMEATIQTPHGPILIGRTSLTDPQAMRGLCDQQRQKGAAAVFVGSAADDKVTLIAMVSQELAKAGRISASEWVKAVAPIVSGSGGGKPILAQAGGKDVAKLPEALAAAASWAREKAV